MDDKYSQNYTNSTAATSLGLQAVYAACSEIYHDQPNPLQVTTKVKYW